MFRPQRLSSTQSDKPLHQPTALLVANTGWYLYNFRRELIRDVAAAGWHVVLVCADDTYARKLIAEGWPVATVAFPGGDLALGREARALWQLDRIIRKHRPLVVHLFTLKCVLYGALAGTASRMGARYIGAITGLGYLFSNNKPKTKLLRRAVVAALTQAVRRIDTHLIFQNALDYQELEHALPAHRMHLIRGSGVDLTRFRPPATERSYDKPLVVTYCGRLIAEKGINDFLEAIALAREQGAAIESRIAGAPFPGNPSSMSKERLKALKTDTKHTYLGHANDTPALFQTSDIVVLPTYYREGTPKTLLEALAAGCVIITTNITACDDIVDEHKNGFRVDPRSPHQIAEHLLTLNAMSRSELAQYAKHSRWIAETRFAVDQVNQQTLALYPAPAHGEG